MADYFNERPRSTLSFMSHMKFEILGGWDIEHPLPAQILYLKKSSMVEALMKFTLNIFMH